ncbi:MAG: GNAT family N-acetyltransferase [Verrucomicrobia bacterium]|nr:GNAT family N-acetyltransferase [Verrucomicrobiota bacterium]MBV9672094.1 GNAT family N-acetyltransferase [Verrucomicrobiota bacterium]
MPIRGLKETETKDRPLHSIKTRFGSATLVDHIAPNDYEIWVAGFKGYALDHRYYEIVHESLKDQFSHYYLVLKDSDGSTRAIQPVILVSQDLATGTPAAFRRILNRVRTFIPGFLKLRMLMVGCSAGEGDIVREKNDSAINWTINALGEVLVPTARLLKVPLIVFKDFPRSYRPQLDTLNKVGFIRVPSMPATKLELNFADFEHYLQTRVSHATRKNLRRKFRKSESGGPIEFSVVTNVSPWVEELLSLYRQTLQRSQFRFEELNADYLLLLGNRMEDRARFFIWRRAGKIIAFASCLVHDCVLRDNYIGLDYSVALDLHLYFVTWRDTINWALENKIRVYHSAPLNYDPKYHFRMDLEPLDLFARSPYPWLNIIFKRLLPILEPTRYDPVIRKFANASELNE